MVFMRMESWPIDRVANRPLALPRWMSGRTASTSVALVLSLAVDLALVSALILAAETDEHSSRSPAKSIKAFDLPSPENREAGAAAADRQKIHPAPSQKTEVVVAKAHMIPAEWSITTLAPPPERAAAPAPMATASPGPGAARSGAGVGSGDDPYAFASYRTPSRDGLSDARTSVPTPMPAAVSTLEARLRRALHRPGLRVTLRVAVDRDGRIDRVDAADPLTLDALATVSRIAQAFALFDRDAGRPPSVAATVALDL